MSSLTGGERAAAQRRGTFLIHLWHEDLGNGEMEWRGKVQHIPNGEVIYFREWATLEEFMAERSAEASAARER